MNLVAIMFKNKPVYVGNGPTPFEISLNNEIVYSKLFPLNGEMTPIFFAQHAYWGKPNPKHYDRLIENINKLL